MSTGGETVFPQRSGDPSPVVVEHGYGEETCEKDTTQESRPSNTEGFEASAIEGPRILRVEGRFSSCPAAEHGEVRRLQYDLQ